MRKVFVAVLAASVLGVGAVSAEATVPAPSAQPTTADKNIVQTAVAAGQFKTLVMLAKRAGLARALTGEKKLTVFAPTDAAFRKVPKATLNKLLRNRAQLRRVLHAYLVYYHSARTHLSLDKDAPEPRPVERPAGGRIVQTPLIGGLHHRYSRRAA